MPEIKLARLPDRTTMKLAISVMPDLHQALNEYVDAYEAAYGQRESVADLIPFMLASFLESDRAFAAARKSRSRQ
ncbi:MAG: hypothetical protein JWL96_3744 [Sphingomonas bacterium]|uniref:DUF2274 domain-containing protein n=1 Tax=Sphingomonas bacterium TaxID=1895847 RepID=UPI002607358A|nr:DUF2274 domain-containing protein [Sphingomonas bacterium]MDB5711674.1 hypothetical protein [Sphingomonas bacterium]